MNAFVYVDSSKNVGDAEHVRVFANVDAAEMWFEENDPEGALRSNMKFWLRRPGGSRKSPAGPSQMRGQGC